MGVQNTVTVTCDYPKCKAGQNGARTVQWISEEVKAGQPLPEGADEFISLNLNGQVLAFCGRLDAARFFLPDGFEIQAKKIVEFPDNGNFPKTEPETQEK